MKRKWYPKWKTQKGEAIEVTPLEFIEYYKVNGSYFQWEEEGVFYEGQIWKCRLPNKTVKPLTFRFEVNELDRDSYTKNTSLPVNKNPIMEKAPNPITDSWEECTLGIISKDLFPRLDLLGEYIKILVDIEKEEGELSTVATARLNLLQQDNAEDLKEAYMDYVSLDRDLKAQCKSEVYQNLYK